MSAFADVQVSLTIPLSRDGFPNRVLKTSGGEIFAAVRQSK